MSIEQKPSADQELNESELNTVVGGVGPISFPLDPTSMLPHSTVPGQWALNEEPKAPEPHPPITQGPFLTPTGGMKP